MAKLTKCDVVECAKVSEGEPAGRAIVNGVEREMCSEHTNALVGSYFPDLRPNPATENKEPGTPSETTAADKAAA